MRKDELTTLLDQQFAAFYRHMTAYIDERLEAVDQRFEHIEGRLDQVVTILDDMRAKQQTSDQERLALTAQADRHQRWISQLAEHTKARLRPELPSG